MREPYDTFDDQHNASIANYATGGTETVLSLLTQRDSDHYLPLPLLVGALRTFANDSPRHSYHSSPTEVPHELFADLEDLLDLGYIEYTPRQGVRATTLGRSIGMTLCLRPELSPLNDLLEGPHRTTAER